MTSGWVRGLAAFLAVELTGCFSLHTQSRRVEEEEAGVAVVVYADDGARRAGRPGPEGVFSQLERREGGRWQPVFRSLASRWAVRLPAGTYRLRFPVRLLEDGRVVPLSARSKKLVVKPGEAVQVEAVLEHLPVALVVVGVVVVTVVAVALSKWLKEADLPEPPLPPPELFEVAFHLTLDWAAGPWPSPADRAAPVVTSHFPTGEATLPSGPVRVVWVFSEPLSPTSLDPGKIRVLGERSGLLSGVASYDPRHWWVQWESRQSVPAQRLYVTLDAGAVEDLAGNQLAEPVSFSFLVR